MATRKKSESTRHSNKDWMIGNPCDQSLSVGVRLPLNKSVLQRFLFLRNLNVKMGNRDIFELILIELKEIWSRAAVPIKNGKKCLDQMISLHGNWKIVNKNNNEERLSSQFRLQVL